MLTFWSMSKYSEYVHSDDTDFVAIVDPKWVIIKNMSFTQNNKSKQYKLSYTLVGGGEEQFSLVSMFYI